MLWRHSCSNRMHTSLRNILKRPYQSHAGVFGLKPSSGDSEYMPKEILDSRAKHSNVWRYVSAYRDHGHERARIDPLNLHQPISQALLKPGIYHLTSDIKFPTQGIVNMNESFATVDELEAFLESAYCGNVALDFSHVEELEKDWLAHRWEGLSSEKLTDSEKLTICREMLRCQAYDFFLANKFATVKRYGCEGAESMTTFFTECFRVLASDGVQQVVIGMPHRGRLNLLTGALKLPPRLTYAKMKGALLFSEERATVGDVLSHLTSSVDLDVDGHALHVTMLPNPSHLEAVNPVAVGKTRARQRLLLDGEYDESDAGRAGDKVACIQVHGDAAIAGQGVVQETLAMSRLPHFNVGGSIHLIVNNQVGFTTPAERARSSRYCSDVAKMINAPVLHVNGARPESVLKATRLAIEYQRKFRKDVFIDLLCFRRWGHNELDDPMFTNPKMYKVIQSAKTIPDTYVEKLIGEKVIAQVEADRISQEYSDFLRNELDHADAVKIESDKFGGLWTSLARPSKELTVWDTGVDLEVLKFVGSKSIQYPSDFLIHPHLKKSHVDARLSRLVKGDKLDWATGEALAFGSLLYQGFDVRLCGQDVGRGTFSQRHAMLVDQETGEITIPLNDMNVDGVGKLELVNSLLSEEGVLGFEYGYSISSPNCLPIWEAQFGDFNNGAQIIIDTFVTCGENKWMLQSGLVMLLPHGLDGAGPEHSSSRLERFLLLSSSSETEADGDAVNFSVAFPTTPAQYFHLLRRQMVRNFRKPLVVASPKTLLRLPEAKSDLAEFGPGSVFKNVLDDPRKLDRGSVTTIILCSGKHYYTVEKERAKRNINNTAIIRLESLVPFPAYDLQELIKRYPKARVFVWSQEEHRNSGAWIFVQPRFRNLLGIDMTYAGRNESPVPAVGSSILHAKELQQVLADTFESFETVHSA